MSRYDKDAFGFQASVFSFNNNSMDEREGCRIPSLNEIRLVACSRYKVSPRGAQHKAEPEANSSKWSS